MLRPRVIPVLTMQHLGMVKTRRFKDPVYLGDPINAVRVLNSKEVDELIILDITATREGRAPDPDELRNLASECFMPVCYGGGIRSSADAEAILRCGYEKVSINSSACADPALIQELAREFGSQAVVVSIDVERRRRSMTVREPGGGRRSGAVSPVDWIRRVVDAGAGEVVVTAVDRDGTGEGYDLELVSQMASAVDVPVVALGGAGSLQDLRAALEAGAAAAAAGRLFLTRGKHLAALVSYPSPEEVESLPTAPQGAG